MTDKLYERDSHIRRFEAKVLSCEKMPSENKSSSNEEALFEVVLDKTAFFPGGGGQKADGGTINGIKVTAVKQRGDEVIHCIALKLTAGESVIGEIDWESRLSRMQNHSGEHILSGLINSEYGFDNVGFHMGSEFLEIDFSGKLNGEDIKHIEKRANEIIAANNPVNILFPKDDELDKITYRSKGELSGQVRIVEITGADRCACCAPHVKQTGEVGIIKILKFLPNRGGTRLNVVCGMDALEDYNRKSEELSLISRAVSAKQDSASKAVERLVAQQEITKQALSSLNRSVLEMRIASLPERVEGNICIFESAYFDAVCARALANEAVLHTDAIAAVFCGSDREGYRYCISSSAVDLKEKLCQINEALKGNGGGSAVMIQGNCKAGEVKIKRFFDSFK
ncbi:MAG: alanyl-tRNA editing protein [Eubacteriaceae bacterium]|jgi:alanyl-tRNA synthetase|nr:alanyl-tRNA editing protein [Eubacteriaceae bacterium]